MSASFLYLASIWPPPPPPTPPHTHTTHPHTHTPPHPQGTYKIYASRAPFANNDACAPLHIYDVLGLFLKAACVYGPQ